MIFWMLRILVTVNKPYYVPYVSRVTTSGTSFTKLPFDVSKEWVRSWSHTYFLTNFKTFLKRLLVVPPKTLKRERKRRKSKGNVIWKLFALHPNKKKKDNYKAFCVMANAITKWKTIHKCCTQRSVVHLNFCFKLKTSKSSHQTEICWNY